MLEKTQRSYTCIHSGFIFDMYINPQTHELSLFNSDLQHEVKGFYLAAHTDVEYKFKDGSILSVPRGYFFDQNKVVNKPIRKKLFPFNKWSKIQ